MSAQGVLAVMDASIASADAIHSRLGGKHCVTNDLREARATVAELIEALEDAIGSGLTFDDTRARDRVSAALSAINGDYALARAGGAK